MSHNSVFRVASTARSDYNEAMQVAFKGGYFAAIINIALALFGICGLYLVYYFTISMGIDSGKEVPIEKIPLLMIGYGFGASFVAMFAQLGGGIYTKAADVGADLIGKIYIETNKMLNFPANYRQSRSWYPRRRSS